MCSSGHHLWTELLEQPLFDCVWINGRHYNRDIGDGVPRTTVKDLSSGFQDQFKLRKRYFMNGLLIIFTY